MPHASLFPPLRTVLLVSALFLPAAGPALAGVPAPPEGDGIPCDPALRSVFELGTIPAGCQYRFNAAGDLDELLVIATLRDCFDTPVPDCGIQATLTPTAGTEAFCSCEPAVQVVPTDVQGAAQFVFSRLGGRGSLSVALTAVCVGQIGLTTLDFDFTTPDLNGSCEPNASTTIIDLALWSMGLSQYAVRSDLNCDGQVGVVDLALWAHGLGVGCP